MKKTFLLLAALLTATVMNVRAEVLLNDNFNYDAGDLTKKDMLTPSKTVQVDKAEWYYTSTTATKVQVYDTALTYKDYCTNKVGRTAYTTGNVNKAVRAFDKVSSGSVYYSMLINVKNLRNSTSKDYFFSLTEGVTTAGKNFARANILNNYNEGTFQLGISKATDFYRYSQKLPADSTYLIVVEYIFVEGEKNDSVCMWINPTKVDSLKPTLVCVQDTLNLSQQQKGAKSVADASYLSWAYLKPSGNTPTNMFYDEIRVATKWVDLFEGAPTEASLSINPTSISENSILQGESKEYTISVSGKLLTEGVTITHTNNAEVTLSTSSISKEDALAGTSFKVTINAETAEVVLYDTITLVSGTVSKKMPVAWYATSVTACADVAALKAAVEYEEAYNKLVRLTGEAIVTRDVNSGTRELFIEDASGAAKLTDDYGLLDAGSLVGAKIKNLLLLNGQAAWGVQPFMVQGKPTVVSTGNEVEPQVVTLAELQENAADYLYEVVEIQGVTFTTPGGTFAVGQSAFTQGTDGANVKVENNSLVGVTVPVKANVIGFSFNTSGSVILPRGAADVVNILYTRTVTSGNFGTICLDRKFTAMEGVEGLFVPYEKTDDMLYCEEVALSDVVAGGAYIFKANAAEIKFTLDGEAVTASINNDNMIGWLAADSILAAKPAYYLLANNQIMEPEIGSTIKQNRAFIDLANVPAQAAAPARGRLISFGVNATNTPTGMVNVNANVNANRKMMINGQLIIIRDGKMFNAQGQEL